MYHVSGQDVDMRMINVHYYVLGLCLGLGLSLGLGLRIYDLQ